MNEISAPRQARWFLPSLRRLRHVGIVAVVAAAAMVLVGLQAAPAGAADPCGPPVTSVIACENSKPGDAPADWQVNGSGDATIQGFATSISVNVGGTVQFKVNTTASSYHIDILRLGYYQGNGARKIVAGHAPDGDAAADAAGVPRRPRAERTDRLR